MRLRGNDVEDALRDWVKSEIKEAAQHAYDLGKFFFSVSVGTIGAEAAIEKLNSTSRMDAPMLSSFLVLLVSILLAINLARPRRLVVGGETDLLQLYNRQVTLALIQTWTWFVLWLAGAILGVIAVRT